MNTIRPQGDEPALESAGLGIRRLDSYRKGLQKLAAWHEQCRRRRELAAQGLTEFDLVRARDREIVAEMNRRNRKQCKKTYSKKQSKNPVDNKPTTVV